MKIKEFLNECHDKDVIKNLSIYIVSSWVLIQVVSVVAEPFGLPKKSMTYLLLFLLVGFPFYIYLLWILQLKTLDVADNSKQDPQLQLRRASSKSGVQVKAHKWKILNWFHFRSGFHKMYFTFLLIISTFSLFSATLIVRANFIKKPDLDVADMAVKPAVGNKIALLKFDNNTMNDSLDVIGKMAVDWIMHGITQNKVGQVISPKIIEDYTKVLRASTVSGGENTVVIDYLKPSRIITGTYYLTKGRLLIQCSIFNENMEETIISFDAVECSSESPLDCIEALKQKVLGYLATEKEEALVFGEVPPNYEAYQFLLEAHTKYNNTEPDHLRLLNDAIAADSSFFAPKVDRIVYYYNIDEFAMADSLYTLLSKETSTNERQMNLLRMYAALLRGKNRRAYNLFKYEYNLEPFDLENSYSAMVLAMQYVNRPEDVDTIYNALSMDGMDMDNCEACEFRNYMKALSLIELGHPEEVLEMLGPFANKTGHLYAKEALIRAYAILGKKEAADELLDNLKLTATSERWLSLSLFCGKEFLNQGNKKAANEYFDLVINAIQGNHASVSEKEFFILPQAYFYKGNYPKVQELLETTSNSGDDPYTNLAILAISCHKNGFPDKANRYLRELDSLRADYQYGVVDYAYAQYFAAIDEETKAMDYLMKAVASGKRYSPSKFQHDILFKPYWNSDAFKKVMNFWK